MNTFEIDALSKDPANWRLRAFYFCKKNPRIIVPKRNPEIGWTINFGRKLGIPVLLGIFILLLVPTLVAIPFGPVALLFSVIVSLFEAAILVGLLLHFGLSKRDSTKKKG